MKRILLFLFIISSVSLFSQTEIWGVKTQAGNRNGGILFSIDSATSQIETRHRFGGYIPANTGAQMIYLEESGEWMGMVSDYIFKFSPSTGNSVFKLAKPFSSGSFLKAADGFYYIISGNSWIDVCKINPETLDIEYIDYQEREKVNYRIVPQSIGLTELNTNFLTYQKRNNIFRLNLGNDSLYLEHSFDDWTSHPNAFGSLIAVGDKFYGLTSRINNDTTRFCIYSYDYENQVFKNEFSFPNEHLSNSDNYTWIGDFMLASNGLIYGTVMTGHYSKRYNIFSFNPEDNHFEMLAGFYANEEKPIGKIVEGPNQILYGVCQPIPDNNGCVFSYNINTDKLDHIYYFNDENEINTIGNVSLTDDDKLIGLYDTKASLLEMKIFTYDIENNAFEILLNKEWDPSPALGKYPKKIIQLDDGNIIGYTEIGGDPNDVAHGKGVLFQYTPETDDYEVKFASQDINAGYSFYDIFKMKGNKVLVYLKRQYGYDDTNYASYLYDTETNEIQFQDSLTYPYWYDFQHIQESNISIIYVMGPWGARKLYRYQPLSGSLVEICDFEPKGSVNNLCFYEPNVLIYTYAINSTFSIKKFNIITGEHEIVYDLLEYQTNPEYTQSFVFRVTEDGSLNGEYVESYIWDPVVIYERRSVKLNLETLEMADLFDYQFTETMGHYTYIDDYSNSGTMYAVSFSDYMDNAHNNGYLFHLDYENSEMIKLDSLELVTHASSYMLGTYLAKFKKTKEYDNVQKVEKSNFKIYYSQERLIIQSKEYISQAQISIFDMSGRLFYELVEHDFTNIEKPVHLKSGAYVVQVQADSKMMSEKIMVIE